MADAKQPLEPECEFCGDTGLRRYPATRITTNCNRCQPADRTRRQVARERMLSDAMNQFRRDNPQWTPFAGATLSVREAKE